MNENNDHKYYEKESNAPANWVANKIIIRDSDGKIQEIYVQDDE